MELFEKQLQLLVALFFLTTCMPSHHHWLVIAEIPFQEAFLLNLAVCPSTPHLSSIKVKSVLNRAKSHSNEQQHR